MAIHNEFKKQLLEAQGTSFKLALMTSSYTPNIDTQNFFSDVSANEVVAPGYTAGGKALVNVSVTKDNATDKAKLDADDLLWTNLDLSGTNVAYLVIYKNTGAANTSTIVQSKRLKDGAGNDATFNGNYAQFPVPMPAEGILVGV